MDASFLDFDNFPSDRQRDISVKTINQHLIIFERKKSTVKLLSEYLIKNNLDEIHSKFFKINQLRVNIGLQNIKNKTNFFYFVN